MELSSLMGGSSAVQGSGIAILDAEAGNRSYNLAWFMTNMGATTVNQGYNTNKDMIATVQRVGPDAAYAHLRSLYAVVNGKSV